MLARTSYPPSSHDAKALVNIIDTFPRDLLFRIPEDELYETALALLFLSRATEYVITPSGSAMRRKQG